MIIISQGVVIKAFSKESRRLALKNPKKIELLEIKNKRGLKSPKSRSSLIP